MLQICQKCASIIAMRIITGKARGLKLKTPKGLSTRPTSDRIKESLFSILNGMIDFDGLNVLDLFAGTGALGLESLSRGAAHAVFIDKSTTDIISENVKHAHFEEISTIIRGDVFKLLDKLNGQDKKFELIFCDAPYNQGLWQRALTFVDKYQMLSSDGLLIIEHGFNEIFESQMTNIEVVKKVKYGHTTEIVIYKNFRK